MGSSHLSSLEVFGNQTHQCKARGLLTLLGSMAMKHAHLLLPGYCLCDLCLCSGHFTTQQKVM